MATTPDDGVHKGPDGRDIIKPPPRVSQVVVSWLAANEDQQNL